MKKIIKILLLITLSLCCFIGCSTEKPELTKEYIVGDWVETIPEGSIFTFKEFKGEDTFYFDITKTQTFIGKYTLTENKIICDTHTILDSANLFNPETKLENRTIVVNWEVEIISNDKMYLIDEDGEKYKFKRK